MFEKNTLLYFVPGCGQAHHCPWKGGLGPDQSRQHATASGPWQLLVFKQVDMAWGPKDLQISKSTYWYVFVLIKSLYHLDVNFTIQLLSYSFFLVLVWLIVDPMVGPAHIQRLLFLL